MQRIRYAGAALLLTSVTTLTTPSAHAAAVRGYQHVAVPAAARAVDTSHPTRRIGRGTPRSCTSAAVVAAVRAGGVIRFNCGSRPVTIHMHATAKVENNHGPQLVLDGQNRITLDGGGRHRILYLDTCDPEQIWTTSHCQDQAAPRLVVQNLRLMNGNSTGQSFDGGGGGAIFVRGGRLKIVHSTFEGNSCERNGPDLGGAAVRVLSQFRDRPVYVVDSTFRHGHCSNGAALSSIGVSWVVLNSRFIGNRAVGRGANPAQSGTVGGSGGAIYTDGDRYTVRIGGCQIVGNHANEGGGAIFFVSNDRTGTLSIDRSTLQHNPNDGFATDGMPGIFFLGAHRPTITNTILRP